MDQYSDNLLRGRPMAFQLDTSQTLVTVTTQRWPGGDRPLLGRQQLEVVVDVHHGHMQVVHLGRGVAVTQTQLLHLPLPVHLLDREQALRLVVVAGQEELLAKIHALQINT